MLKLLVVALLALGIYQFTGRHPVPAEVKGLIAMALAVTAIWFGIARTGNA